MRRLSLSAFGFALAGLRWNGIEDGVCFTLHCGRWRGYGSPYAGTESLHLTSSEMLRP